MESKEADSRLITIHRLQERADIYRSISAPVAFVAGSLSMAASALLMWKLQGKGARVLNSDLFFGAWILVLILTVITALILLRRNGESGPSNSTALSDRARFAIESVVPHALTAIALGLLLSWRGSALSLSIVWVTLYGLALSATGPFAPASLVTLGKAFLITGLSLMLFVYFRIKFLIGYDRSDSQTLMIMGLSFGLFHIVYAVEVWSERKPRAS